MTTITITIELKDTIPTEAREALCQDVIRTTDKWEYGMGFALDDDMIKVKMDVTDDDIDADDDIWKEYHERE